MTPDTPFLIGSGSKPLTALLVAQLVDDGVLTWDEPVWPHLSALADEAPAGFETVTVEQLITHTGGLSMMAGTAGAVRIHAGEDALDRRVAELLSQPLVGAPGEEFVYSNAGPTLAAGVIEQVTGRSFADELRDRVFEPLGMTGSFATGDDPLAANMASGHQQWFRLWLPVELPYDDAGAAMGYIGSTAADLATFMHAHLDGHPATPATATDIAGGPVFPTGWSTALDAGYGRGWFVDELGTPIVSHPGSLGHFTAHMLLAPETDLGVAVMTNASAFVAAGHDAQYDLGLGLIHMLLAQDWEPAGPSLLMTTVVPVTAWTVLALMIAVLVRYLVRLTIRVLRDRASTGFRPWVRALLPAAALLGTGASLLTAPLGIARHFYPDVGWATSLIAWSALAGGTARLVIPTLALAARTTAGHPPTAP